MCASDLEAPRLSSNLTHAEFTLAPPFNLALVFGVYHQAFAFPFFFFFFLGALFARRPLAEPSSPAPYSGAPPSTPYLSHLSLPFPPPQINLLLRLFSVPPTEHPARTPLVALATLNLFAKRSPEKTPCSTVSKLSFAFRTSSPILGSAPINFGVRGVIPWFKFAVNPFPKGTRFQSIRRIHHCDSEIHPPVL